MLLDDSQTPLNSFLKLQDTELPTKAKKSIDRPFTVNVRVKDKGDTGR
jgi:hypothetical protein